MSIYARWVEHYRPCPGCETRYDDVEESIRIAVEELQRERDKRAGVKQLLARADAILRDGKDED